MEKEEKQVLHHLSDVSELEVKLPKGQLMLIEELVKKNANLCNFHMPSLTLGKRYYLGITKEGPILDQTPFINPFQNYVLSSGTMHNQWSDPSEYGKLVITQGILPLINIVNSNDITKIGDERFNQQRELSAIVRSDQINWILRSGMEFSPDTLAMNFYTNQNVIERILQANNFDTFGLIKTYDRLKVKVPVSFEESARKESERIVLEIYKKFMAVDNGESKLSARKDMLRGAIESGKDVIENGALVPVEDEDDIRAITFGQSLGLSDAYKDLVSLVEKANEINVKKFVGSIELTKGVKLDVKEFLTNVSESLEVGKRTRSKSATTN